MTYEPEGDQSSSSDQDQPLINYVNNAGRLINRVIVSKDAGPKENVEEIGGETKKKPRKRVMHSEQWKRNVKKLKVNSGLAYISEGGREVSAKVLKVTCTEKCRFKCRNNFTQEERQDIHSSFWKLADNALHRQFVASHMTILKTNYHRKKEGSQRSDNLSYFLTLNGTKIKVCKKFFMNTLDVGDKFIRTTWSKAQHSNAMVKRDSRGNYQRKESVGPEIKDQIRNHINKFPRIESHYLRAQTTREFLDGSLTLSEMYRMYKEEQNSNGLPVAKFCMYSQIFNTEFNLSFFSPKKDQCAICETFKNSNDEEKEQLKNNYDRHQLNKSKSREEKSKDVLKSKENPEIIVAVFDLQAVLPTPFGEISTFYYKCRLNSFNNLRNCFKEGYLLFLGRICSPQRRQ